MDHEELLQKYLEAQRMSFEDFKAFVERLTVDELIELQQDYQKFVKQNQGVQK